VPRTTLRYHSKTVIAPRGSPYLTPDQRQEFADWVLTHSRMHMCLTKQLLNAKVMQLAALNGHDLNNPPGKHFWHDFFKEVNHFYFSVLNLTNIVSFFESFSICLYLHFALFSFRNLL
jgi:hypothetical protein